MCTVYYSINTSSSPGCPRAGPLLDPPGPPGTRHPRAEGRRTDSRAGRPGSRPAEPRTRPVPTGVDSRAPLPYGPGGPPRPERFAMPTRALDAMIDPAAPEARFSDASDDALSRAQRALGLIPPG